MSLGGRKPNRRPCQLLWLDRRSCELPNRAEELCARLRELAAQDPGCG